MTGILWLASYPKSGNTWVRVFLSNLLRDSEEPVDINHLARTPVAGSRTLFDDWLGVSAADLSAAEIDALRPRLYEEIAREARGARILKVHDARVLGDGQTLFTGSATRGAIYVVRDPRDVAVSFAHHMGVDADHAIECMAREDFTLAAGGGRLPLQLRQRLSTWSGNVASWLDHDEFPVHVVRYEDLQRDPFQSFSALARFAGLDATPERVRRAIGFSDFRALRQQEQDHGFNERPASASRFFRRGEAGVWAEELTPSQAARVLSQHRHVMNRLGYDEHQVNPRSIRPGQNAVGASG